MPGIYLIYHADPDEPDRDDAAGHGDSTGHAPAGASPARRSRGEGSAQPAPYMAPTAEVDAEAGDTIAWDSVRESALALPPQERGDVER